MRSLETARVTYTSDALKCTVVRAEALPMAARKKPCVIEAQFGDGVQCSRKQKPDTDSGVAECESSLILSRTNRFCAFRLRC